MVRSFILLLLAIGLILTPSILSAQPALRDVVYLKNGSIIRGIVLEQIPEKTIRIQTADGSIFVYQMSEVERIVKEPVTAAPTATPAEVEQPRSSGALSILGGGALPTGKFAAKDGDQAGAAKFGYCLGLEYSNISQGGMYFAIGATFSSNPLDESVVGAGAPSGYSVEVKPWKTIVPTISLGFGSTSSGVRAFFAGQIGAAFCTSPEVSVNSMGMTFSSKSSNATALCFGGVLGFQTAGKFSLSVRYLTTKPKFKITYPGSSTETELEQPIGMVQFVAGLGF